MKPGLCRNVLLLIALLPMVAGAQSGVDGTAADSVAAAAADEIKAGEVAYMAGFNTLYRVDLSTAAATVVGTAGFGSVAGVAIADVDSLAFAPDGTLYAVADSPQALFRVSTSTGRATLVGQFRENNQPFDTSSNLNGVLAFTCDGRLLLSSRVSHKVWEVNPANAAASLIGTMSPTVGGLAVLGNQIFALGVGGSEGFYAVNAADATTARLPSGLDGRTIPGGSLAFAADGRLFAVFDLYPPVERSVLAELSPVSGAVLRESTLTGPQLGPGADRRQVRALAIAPPVCAPTGVGPVATSIPATDPRSLLLLATAFGLLAAGVLRRRARGQS
jgi:hypothetical protein